MYFIGQGVVQDYAEAVRWYRLAAQQGNASAQHNRGPMYDNGQGVVQDYVKAHSWFNLGAIMGDADAVKNRDIVAKRMTSQKIAEAQKMARDCQARNFKACDGRVTIATMRRPQMCQSVGAARASPENRSRPADASPEPSSAAGALRGKS
jgi:TPR repeat protein